MPVDTTHAKAIADRIKRSAERRPDILDLCDYVLAQGPQVVVPIKPVQAGKPDCPVCAARRQAKALAMKKWRSRR